MVSEKKLMLKFCCCFQREEMCPLSPLNMCEYKKIVWYVHDLLDVINIHTMFHLNRIRTNKFQLNFSDIAVTLKFIHGHWKWYKWIKLDKQFHNAKFDTYHIMSKKIGMLNILPRRSASRPDGPNSDHYVRLGFFTRVQKGEKEKRPLENNDDKAD